MSCTESSAKQKGVLGLLKINDVEITSNNIVLETVTPPEKIGYTNRWASLEGLPMRYVSIYYKPYARRATLRIFGHTKKDAIRVRSELIGKLITNGLAKIELRHESTYELGKLEEFNTGLWEAGTLPVEAVFMCPYGVSFGGDHEETIGTVTLAGTAKTPPIFIITPTDDTIEISNGREHIRLEGLGTGDITIDCAKRTVIQNGVNIRKDLTIQSRYFNLSPGENNLEIVGGTGKVRWTDRWI